MLAPHAMGLCLSKGSPPIPVRLLLDSLDEAGYEEVRFFLYNMKDTQFPLEWLDDPMFNLDLLVDWGMYGVPMPGLFL